MVMIVEKAPFVPFLMGQASMCFRAASGTVPVSGSHAEEVGLKPQLSPWGRATLRKKAEICPHGCANCRFSSPQLAFSNLSLKNEQTL